MPAPPGIGRWDRGYEAMIEGHTLVDYVGAVRRTIDDSVGIMD